MSIDHDRDPASLRAAQGYHVRLAALHMAHDASWVIADEARVRTVELLEAFETENIWISSTLVEALAAYGLLESARNVDDVQAEIRALMGLVDREPAQAAAKGVIGMQWEDERIVGPYAEAIATLPPAERSELLLLAAQAMEIDNLGADWVLRELVAAAGLESTAVRAAVLRFARAPDPASWFDAQHGARNYLVALQLCARFTAEPPPQVQGSPELDAWALIGELAFRQSREALGEHPGAARGAAIWHALLGPVRRATADVLFALSRMEWLAYEDDDGTLQRLIEGYPAEVREIATWSLIHKDGLQSACRFDDVAGRARYLIGLIGHIGDASVRTVLEELANHPTLGEAAARAMIEIDRRIVSAGP